MSITRLDIHSVRNIHRATLIPSPFLNFIIGPNASGKSSLLESIYLLGRARSFRTQKIKQVIQFNEECAIVSSQIVNKNGLPQQLGIRIDSGKTIIHIDKEQKHRSELAYCLPLQLIHPKSYRLLDAGSQLRREFLDWGIFNLETKFLQDWRKFKQVLQHRNSLLKQKQFDQIDVWDQEFARYATVVSQYRKSYLEQLERFFFELASYFFEQELFSIRYVPGWDCKRELTELLRLERARDVRYGCTQYGPHRCDFQVLVEKLPVKDIVSRGQLKLLVLVLKLAQIKLFNQFDTRSVCILVDDLSAELDIENTQKLIKYLSELNCQVFMTSTEMKDFFITNELADYQLFHVKQGGVSAT